MIATRRQLMLSGVRIGAGGIVYLVLGGCGPNGETRSFDISAVLLEPSRVHQIGRVYARKFPKKTSANDLERRVLEGLPGNDSIDDEINRRLQDFIRDDFAAERVFLYRGWILSHTEGLLCTLALEPAGRT